MGELDVVMLYFAVSVVLCGFIAAFWYALRLKSGVTKPTCDKIFFDCLADGCDGTLTRLGTSGQCDVCGSGTSLATCSDCLNWAEIQTMVVRLRSKT